MISVNRQMEFKGKMKGGAAKAKRRGLTESQVGFHSLSSDSMRLCLMNSEQQQSAAAIDIVDTVTEDGRFQKLIHAWQTADLVNVLKSDGPVTLLAPTDEAFGNLPPGSLEKLLNDIPSLRGLLLHHLLPGRVTVVQLADSAELQTALGETLSTWSETGVVRLDEAEVLDGDIEAANGLIHAIDTVLLPPGVQL